MPEDRRSIHYNDLVRYSGSWYPGFDAQSSQLALSLLYTYDVFHQSVGRYMAGFGLSKSTFNVLMLLRHGPVKGMQLHELGELLLVSRANITGLIDQLEGKGYVTRAVDSADRRVRYARITKKAEMLLDDFVPLHFCNLKVLMQDLTIEEKELLTALLQKTRSSLMAHGNECKISDPAVRQERMEAK